MYVILTTSLYLQVSHENSILKLFRTRLILIGCVSTVIIQHIISRQTYLNLTHLLTAVISVLNQLQTPSLLDKLQTPSLLNQLQILSLLE